jgi:hypothetical protein
MILYLTPSHFQGPVNKYIYTPVVPAACPSPVLWHSVGHCPNGIMDAHNQKRKNNYTKEKLPYTNLFLVTLT